MRRQAQQPWTPHLATHGFASSGACSDARHRATTAFSDYLDGRAGTVVHATSLVYFAWDGAYSDGVAQTYGADAQICGSIRTGGRCQDVEPAACADWLQFEPIASPCRAGAPDLLLSFSWPPRQPPLRVRLYGDPTG